jgi:predicted metalloprotease with PDZ domain
MFCLVADVRIRQQTHNQKGLQDALRGILNAGGTINQDWDIERAFAVGDKVTGTTVLTDLYRQMANQPDPVDLAALWKQLGISRDSNGAIKFDSKAPSAQVRTAITQIKAVAP